MPLCQIDSIDHGEEMKNSLPQLIAYWRLPCSKIFKKSLNQGISRLWSKTPRFVQCVPESAIEQTGSTFAQLLLNRRWFSWELHFLNRSKTLNRPTSRITAEHLSGPQAGTCQSPAQFHLCRSLITVIKYSQQACVSVSGRRRCKITLYSFYATSIKIFTTAQYDMSHAHSVGKTCVCVFKRRARSARTEGANAFSLGIIYIAMQPLQLQLGGLSSTRIQPFDTLSRGQKNYCRHPQAQHEHSTGATSLQMAQI